MMEEIRVQKSDARRGFAPTRLFRQSFQDRLILLRQTLITFKADRFPGAVCYCDLGFSSLSAAQNGYGLSGDRQVSKSLIDRRDRCRKEKSVPRQPHFDVRQGHRHLVRSGPRETRLRMVELD